MAKYIKGIERGQQVLFQTNIDDLIESNNEVRVIDMFVEKINLDELGINKSVPNIKGTNHYDPRDILKEAKEIIEKDIITNITDKGYNDRKEMMECLKEGIIPEVTLPRNQKEYELETEYEENEIKEEEKNSTKKEDIKNA